ncbi:MAG: hypothetical protein ACYC49_00295 [Ignavibacteriaceae bacterium]
MKQKKDGKFAHPDKNVNGIFIIEAAAEKLQRNLNNKIRFL